MQSRQDSRGHLYSLLVCLAVVWVAASMDLYQVRFVEQNDSKLVATSNYNYAIASPRLLAKSWQAVSVNGDSVLVISTSGERSLTNKSALGAENVAFLEQVRDELANSNTGTTSLSTSLGGGGGAGSNNIIMSSTSNGLPGGSSASFSSSSEQMTSANFDGSVNDMSINVRDNDNFSVARSNLPFNWSRVFFGSNNLLTFVYRNGEVRMLTLATLEPAEVEAVNRLRVEVREMQRMQAKQFSQTMQQSVDMVSNVFGSIMGNFPRPPDFSSSVGGMFGNNFPFGPNNSPFSASAGWPFGSSPAGSGAFAFAGGRR